MKAKSIIISMFVILALCVAAVSCNKDTPSTPVDPGNMDNPNNTEIPDSPTDCIDPEDAVTVNLRNDGGSVEILDWQIAINTANNFVSGSDYVTFVSVGEVSGLGCVTSIPQSGWSNQVAAIPGNGYVLKYEVYNGTTDSFIVKYARLYVVRYLESAANGGILGAEIKYQDNWYWTPVVSTSIITDITPTSAMCGGNVTNDGGMTVTERGICWSTFQKPTINDNHAVSGTGIGNYTIQMTNLMPFTTYYVRAYAKNDIGISYGEQNTFRTEMDDYIYSNIVLNELNGDTKFIEIYNKGNMDVPLEGMYIMKDDYVAGATWTADATIVAPAGGYVLLYSIDVFADHSELPENLFFNSGLSGKKAMRITLFMPDGTVRDEFVRCPEGAEWGAAMSNVIPQSYARTPDGGDWKLTDPTPGRANPSYGEPIPQE